MSPERCISVGGTDYTLSAEERNGQWMATARRVADGQRYGPPAWAPTAEEALDRATAWLHWQQEHQEALRALQDAERAYERLTAGRLWAAADDPGFAELHAEALGRLEEARARLDEVRLRQPR